jgi:hypothetical protein
MSPDGEPQRSPRARRNEQQARVTRFVLGILVLAVLGGAGWGVTWLRKVREEARRNEELDAMLPGPSTRAAATESAPATSRASRPSRVYRPDETIAALRAKHEDGSVESAWRASKELRAEAAAWRAEGAPESDVNRLLAAVLDLESGILKARPAFAELRAARGEVRWPEVMGEFEDLDTRFLTKTEAGRLARASSQFDQVAAASHGWISGAEYEASAGPLVKKALTGRAGFDAMLATVSGRAARQLEIRELSALRNLLPATRFRSFFHLPYVMIVEQDDGWDEEDPAREVARILLGERKTFLDAFAGPIGLTPERQREASVVIFKTRESYHGYCVRRKLKDVLGTEAHFEPTHDPPGERLVVHRDCALATLLHEGAHQLIHAHVRAPLLTQVQAFWFHEGAAEWFAGSRRIADGPDGLPRFEIGLLLQNDVEPGAFLGPIAILKATPAGKRLPLKQLLGLKLSDRDAMAARGAEGLEKVRLVYAQGWFLIYFLNHFSVDTSGTVQFGAKGKYRDVWIDVLRRELAGSSGEEAFLAALAYGKASFDAVEKEMNAYLELVIRKVSKGEFRDQKLIKGDDELR